MSASIEPHAQSKRNKPAPIPSTPLSPVAMSRMTQSSELDEYTASMRSYLANLENGNSNSRKSAVDRDTNRSNGRSENIARSDRDKSPDFCWMDLASLRKEHGSLSHSVPAANENRISKTTTKSVGHHTGKDPRQHHREHRPASPAGKVMSLKRLPPHGAAKSSEKN
jgi:hypothetical protein